MAQTTGMSVLMHVREGVWLKVTCLPAQQLLWGSCWRPRGRGPHHSGRCLCGWAPCSWERWAVENKEGGSIIYVCCNWVWPVVAPYRTPQWYFERERDEGRERRNKRGKEKILPGSWHWRLQQILRRRWCCRDLHQKHGCSCAPRQYQHADPTIRSYL